MKPEQLSELVRCRRDSDGFGYAQALTHIGGDQQRATGCVAVGCGSGNTTPRRTQRALGQLFTVLHDNGVPSETLIFPDDSHGMSRGGRPDRRVLRPLRILVR